MTRIFAIFTALALASVLRAEEPAPLVSKTSIPLPGVEGRIDHATADPVTHRVFFAALENDTLEVVDVNTGKHLHTITGLKKPAGVLFIGGLNLLVAASGEDGTCRFYDGTTYTERGRVSGLDDADNIRYDAKAGRIYLGYGGGVPGVIDPAAMKLTASIALPKHPESFQLEESGSRIFVNLPGAREIAVVDRQAGKVAATWKVQTAYSNFPMALDEAQHRLFVGCRFPARLLVFNTQTGKSIADAPLAGDTDDLFFDAESSRLLASCGEGFVDVFRCDTPAHVERIGHQPTAAGARTAFFSPKFGLCLAVPHRGSQAAEIRVFHFSTTK